MTKKHLLERRSRINPTVKTRAACKSGSIASASTADSASGGTPTKANTATAPSPTRKPFLSVHLGGNPSGKAKVHKIWNKPRCCSHCDRIITNNWKKHWKKSHRIYKKSLMRER